MTPRPPLFPPAVVEGGVMSSVTDRLVDLYRFVDGCTGPAVAVPACSTLLMTPSTEDFSLYAWEEVCRTLGVGP